MDTTLAKAILNEAKTGEYYFKDFPESEAELLEEAEYFIGEARKAIDEGWGKNNPTIMAIANLAKAKPEPSSNGNKFLELPLPEEVESFPDMPNDLTSLTDLKIRSLYGEFNSCLASARWKLAQQQADLARAIHLRDAAYRASYKKLERIDPETDKPKSIPTLEQEAKNDESYLDLDAKATEHNIATIKLRALVDIYAGNVQALSREMTFRHLEWEKDR